VSQAAAERPTLISILEAVLYAAARPVPVKELVALVEDYEAIEVKEALHDLRRRLNSTGSALELVEVAGGWRLQTKPHFARWIRRLHRTTPQRLSKAALETLALVAYKQPITRAEIEMVRGVDSSGTLKFLLEKRLIRIAGKKDAPGKPLLYATTPRFLEIFNLKDLKSLPTLEDLKELEPGHQGQESLPLFQGPDIDETGERR